MSRNRLTHSSDWDEYYQGRGISSELPSYLEKILVEQIWSLPPGKVFELGCGLSPFLIRSAILGWCVCGIDFNRFAINELEDYFERRGLKHEKFIYGNITTIDLDTLDSDYDLLVSFGVLEHFKHPERIIQKWKYILKPGGLFLSVVPNLFSVNARLLKKYDPELWKKHIVISAQQLHDIHVQSGLKEVERACYAGSFDIDMLIPWNRLKGKWPLPIIKFLRYTGTAISKVLELTRVGGSNIYISPIIYGIYQK